MRGLGERIEHLFWHTLRITGYVIAALLTLILWVIPLGLLVAGALGVWRLVFWLAS